MVGTQPWPTRLPPSFRDTPIGWRPFGQFGEYAGLSVAPLRSRCLGAIDPTQVGVERCSPEAVLGTTSGSSNRMWLPVPATIPFPKGGVADGRRLCVREKPSCLEPRPRAGADGAPSGMG